jgi:hypothetical protein
MHYNYEIKEKFDNSGEELIECTEKGEPWKK